MPTSQSAANKRRAPRRAGWDTREADVAAVLRGDGIVRRVLPRRPGGGEVAIGSAILAAIGVRPGEHVRITLRRGALVISRAA